jgi:5-methylcytosine-specific restriction endonuclease McrA
MKSARSSDGPPRKANPAYAGFMFNPIQFLSNVQVRVLDVEEIGALILRIEDALERGDVEYLRRWRFVGRLFCGPRPRRGVTPTVRAAVFARDGYRCRRCGSGDSLQIDHKKPVAWGGTDDRRNLQTLCGPCNRAKGPKPHCRRQAVVA